MFTLALEFADMTACAAFSTYGGFLPSSSGYDTTIVPVRPFVVAPADGDAPPGCAAGPHAATRPVAAATLMNVRREYLDMAASLLPGADYAPPAIRVSER